MFLPCLHYKWFPISFIKTFKSFGMAQSALHDLARLLINVTQCHHGPFLYPVGAIAHRSTLIP